MPCTFQALLLCLGVSAASVLAQPVQSAGPAVTLKVTRDTVVSAYHSGNDNETLDNLGGSPALKVKGIQELSLLDVDPAALRGHTLQAVQLHIRPRGRDILQRVTVSSLASDWVEGTSSRYQPQKGSACFAFARLDEEPWAWLGSDLTAVFGGEGHTLWAFADPRNHPQGSARGWQTIAVAPAVMAARVAGLSHGFVLMDDVGCEYQRQGNRVQIINFPNRFLDSRESGPASGPYFTIELGPPDRLPPQPIESIIVSVKDLPPGQANLQWINPCDNGPAGVLGYLVRYTVGPNFNWPQAQPVPAYLVPLAGPPGDLVHLRLRDLPLAPGAGLTVGVRPVDAAGNLGPTRVVSLQVSAAAPAAALETSAPPLFRRPAPLPTCGGLKVAIIDPLDKVQPITGALVPAHDPGYLAANHLFSARDQLIRLQAGRNEFTAFQILLQGSARHITARVVLNGPNLPQQRLVPTLLKLAYVNTPKGPMPDPLVPLDRPFDLPQTQAGITGQQYAALLADIYVPHDTPPGPVTGRLILSADESTLILPIHLTVWNFTLPDYLSFIPEMNSYGLPGPAGGPLALAYYRLAQENRTCLNRLSYNWAGRPGDDLAPRWDGHFFVWTDWDKRFGPLLDGSAFHDLPRHDVPVDTFYLPLNENWPVPIASGFTGGYWADQALSSQYRQAFVNAVKRLAEHFARHQWDDTLLEFYLNGKVAYKAAGWDRCSAPWTFDEPADTQDFWALRWYGLAFHQGVDEALDSVPGGGPYPKLAFRCDLSRPQWQRNLLDGVMDVAVVGGALSTYDRLVLEHKQRNSQVLLNYASSNNIEDSNLYEPGWCLQAWCLGADGVLPWDTTQNHNPWVQGSDLTLFYPPHGDVQQPAASIRLKAYRTGQQLIEYLTLFQQVTHAPRWQVAHLVESQFDISRPQDVDPEKLWQFRARLGAFLDHAAPPFQRRLVDLRPPLRQVRRLPAIGYIPAR